MGRARATDGPRHMTRPRQTHDRLLSRRLTQDHNDEESNALPPN